MTIASVFWPNIAGRDFHLLPGLVSPRLDHLLRIVDEDDTVVRADAPPPGVNVTFRATWSGFPSSHGIQVNGTTGEVFVADSLPTIGPRLRSFIVTAMATQASTELTARIRFHIHQELRSRWLTPSVLTVRQGSKNMRFSVLARFDDGVIGDITNWSPFRQLADPADRTFVRRRDATTPVHRWTPRLVDAGGTDLHVDVDTGEITCAAATASATVAVQVDLGNPLAKAKANGAPPWTTPVRLTPLSGPGFARMADPDIHNVLLLPDGFTDADRGSFEAYARGIVALLNTRRQTRPFDLLRSKFNYFTGWLASRQAGVSVLNDLVRGDVVGDRSTGRNLDQPEPVTLTPATLTLPQLIDTVGPPTPVFDPPGSPLGTDAAGRAHDWQQLYGALPTVARVGAVYPDWLDDSDRVLVNECDTAFHLALNRRPQVTDLLPDTLLGFNPLRLHRDDFDAFLGALVDDTSAAIEPVWSEGNKDEALVIILSRTNFSAGTNSSRGSGHYICVSLLDHHRHNLVTNPADDGVDLVADPVPAEVSVDPWTTVAHEMAHSFDLDDEYGGLGQIPAASLDDLITQANVQDRKGLLVANSLDVAKIKWRWPRIEKAGVLATDPVDLSRTGAGPFRLPLRKGHAAPFGRGDILRLRERPVASARAASGRLRVTQVQAGDVLEAELVAGEAVDVDLFGEGSVVMVPLRGAAPPGGLGDDLELIHASVLDRIRTTHNPLNAADGDPPDRPCAGEAPVPTGATNFPGGKAPQPPDFSSWVVGLYDNGHTYNCGVYRPTGVCIMAKPHFKVGRSGRVRAYLFCPVCRYAMVDLIDPTQHAAIDADYRRQYPR